MTADELAAHVRRLVDAAPPLTAGQRATLTGILSGRDTGTPNVKRSQATTPGTAGTATCSSHRHEVGHRDRTC